MNSVTEIFSQHDLHNIFKVFIEGKKLLSMETLIIKSQSCDKFPVFVMFPCSPFKWNHLTIYNSNLSKTEGHISQIFNIMAALMGQLTIKFNSIKFNSLGLLIREKPLSMIHFKTYYVNKMNLVITWKWKWNCATYLPLATSIKSNVLAQQSFCGQKLIHSFSSENHCWVFVAVYNNVDLCIIFEIE